MGYFNNGMKIIAIVESFEEAHDIREKSLKTGNFTDVFVGGLNAYFSFKK